MPLRPARVGRVGVIGAPVAKTAVVAKAVSPGSVAGGEDRSRRRRGDTGTRDRPTADLRSRRHRLTPPG